MTGCCCNSNPAGEMYRAYYSAESEFVQMKEYMKDVDPVIKDAIDSGHEGETICWDCQNALGGGNCSWADPSQQKPVEDWVAVKTPNGYCVYACPLFKRCSWACGRYRTAEDYILALEIANKDRRRQIAQIKGNSWYGTVIKCRETIREKNLQIKKLKQDIAAEECWLSTHYSE